MHTYHGAMQSFYCLFQAMLAAIEASFRRYSAVLDANVNIWTDSTTYSHLERFSWTHLGDGRWSLIRV